ncbi:peptidyl-prolyl cis-trans isomerase D [Marinobacter daqiaonensis]|uniref:Periplasmic chaperone PpiD n=1 Tax=Marinobacter daqiaonensis TaxID=650891 RepID=A0A1I6H337_9GAMM|nr:SurA N-terminal domain-containing protein [Marinobacter daqiaonensis]SFR48830.1 peptidyl-prolyl cis-trans isomerase D [Marinobacter daqiaonensis]
MLQDIRDNAQGTIAKIIIAVLIVSLSIWGMDAIVGGFSGEPEVATVNGEEITEREFLRMVQIETQRRLNQMERPDPSMLDEDQLRQEVLESMIREEILAQEAASQGLALSDQGVDQLIVSLPLFQVNGEFSQDRFVSFVRNQGMTVAEFREMLRKDYVSGQIQGAMIQAGVAPAEAARMILAIQQQQRDFRTLTLTGESVADQVKITDADIEAWYEENQSRFLEPESVDVRYLVLSLDNLRDRVEVSEEELRAQYEQTVNELTPEERRTAHILIEDGEQAEEQIQEIQERLEAGEDFAELAREYSDDPLTAEAGGDLGYLVRGDLAEAYDEAMFALDEGEVAGPVETEYGTHFIKLLDVRQSEPPSFEELKPQLRQRLATQRAAEEYARLRTELADLAYAEENLEYPAEQLDLTIRTREDVTRENNEPPFDHPGLVRQLFSGDVLQEGFNTELIDVEENTTVVARVAEHHPEREKPLSEVAGQIRERLERERTLELLRDKADTMLSRLRDGEMTPEGDDWTRYDDVTRNLSAVPGPVQAEAFSLPRPGEGDFRFGSTAVGTDLVLIALSDVTDGEVEEGSEDMRNMRMLLAQLNGQQEYQAYVRTLRERAEVERP